jgi:hypothetical protein
MSTGDFSRGKEFNCPDCLLENGHVDAVPQINFCAYCLRGRVINKLCEIDNVNVMNLSEILANLDTTE